MPSVCGAQVVMPNGAVIDTTVLPRENSVSPFAPESGLTQSTGSPVSGAPARPGRQIAAHRAISRQASFKALADKALMITKESDLSFER